MFLEEVHNLVVCRLHHIHVLRFIWFEILASLSSLLRCERPCLCGSEDDIDIVLLFLKSSVTTHQFTENRLDNIL